MSPFNNRKAHKNCIPFMEIEKQVKQDVQRRNDKDLKKQDKKKPTTAADVVL